MSDIFYAASGVNIVMREEHDGWEGHVRGPTCSACLLQLAGLPPSLPQIISRAVLRYISHVEHQSMAQLTQQALAGSSVGRGGGASGV